MRRLRADHLSPCLANENTARVERNQLLQAFEENRQGRLELYRDGDVSQYLKQKIEPVVGWHGRACIS
jgi:hypothetical protein